MFDHTATHCPEFGKVGRIARQVFELARVLRQVEQFFVAVVEIPYILNPPDTVSVGSDAADSFRSGSFRSDTHSSRQFQAGTRNADVPLKRTSGVTPFRKPSFSVAPRADAADFEPSPVMQLAAGQRIEHNRFGFGHILEISGDASGKKAKIAFDNYGEKILMLNYAKIRIVDIDGK